MISEFTAYCFPRQSKWACFELKIFHAEYIYDAEFVSGRWQRSPLKTAICSYVGLTCDSELLGLP